MALTTECWTLDVDAIVVSGGGHTFGGLGRAVQEHYSSADWASVDLRSVTVDRPGVVEVRASDGIRHIICVTLHDHPDVAPSPQEALRNLPMAVAAALRVAAERGARRIVLPLLGAGGIGLSAEASAAVLVPSTRSALGHSGSSFDSITFLSASAPDAEVIADAWEEATSNDGVAYSDELAYSMSPDIVGADQGIPLTDDHLGVSTYVTMLGTVIAHKDTPLPLSIGLFGEWGSGKSYFMGLLREEIKELSKSKNVSYRPGPPTQEGLAEGTGRGGTDRPDRALHRRPGPLLPEAGG